MTRQPDCPRTGQKVAARATKRGLNRTHVCVGCGRRVGVNYDGTLRRHVTKPKKGS